MELINVCYVSHFPHMKMGGQRSMFHLVEHLDRSRFRPFAICPEPGELSERLEAIGCKCFFVPLVSIKPKNIGKFGAIPGKIRTIIRENNIKILHPDYPSDTFFCWYAALGTGARIIWHVRWNQKAMKDVLFEKICDGIIGVSDGAGRRFSSSRKVRSKYRTIFNGVDCELFRPVEDKNAVRARLGLPEGRFMLLFAGVLKDGKGIYEIAEAVSMLEKDPEVAEMPLTVFVGSQDDRDKLELFKDFVAEMIARGDIRIYSQQKNIHEWMQAADALAIPSHEGNEGMPRVLYEALACGTAGIGSDTSGVNEAITPETGILVREKCPTDIAAAVKKLINDRQLLRELQLNGRERALTHFDIRVHARKVEDFYMEILSR